MSAGSTRRLLHTQAEQAKHWSYRRWALAGCVVATAIAARNQVVEAPDDLGRKAAEAAKEKAQSAGKSFGEWVRTVLRSLGKAPGTAGLDTVGPAWDTAPAATLEDPGTFAGYALRLLGDWCDSADRREVVVALGGGPLLRWLLDVAVAVPGPQEGTHVLAEQQQAERALGLLLSSDLAASLLVGQPGALPRLLRHATSGKAHPNFTAALASRASRGFPQPTGAAAAAPSTSAGAASSRGPAAGEGTGSAVPGMGPGQQLVPCPPAFLADMDDMMGMFLGCLRLDDEQLQGELWNKFEGWAGAAGALSAPSAAPLPPLTSAPAGPTGSSGNGRIVWPNGAAATGGARLGTTEALMAARDRGQPGTSGLGSSALAGSVSSSGGPAGAVPRSGLAVGPGGLELSAQQLAAGFLASLAEADGDNAARLLGLGMARAICAVADAETATERSRAASAKLHPHAGDAEARMGGQRPALDLEWQLVRMVAALASWAGAGSPSDSMAAGAGIGPGKSTREGARGLPQMFSNSDGHARLGEDGGGGGMISAGHHLAACIQPLLYVAADAAVEGDEPLAAFCLRALRLLLERGGAPVKEAAASSTLLPLLRKLATGCGSELRADVARAVTALASAGVISDAADVAHWRAWALSSLMDARHAPPLSQPGLSQLAADADAEGLQEEGAAAAARAAVRSACVAALEALAGVPGLAGMQVAHYWLAAMLTGLATRVWPYNAVVYAGPQVVVNGAGATSSTSNASKGKAGSKNSIAHDPVALLDAVPVLPSHIRNVASALEAASDAVQDDREPPLDFDLGGAKGMAAPALRAAYQQAAHLVDMLLAEQRVCDALEVLGALVAADPAKQAWIGHMGALPLLRRLLEHSTHGSAGHTGSSHHHHHHPHHHTQHTQLPMNLPQHGIPHSLQGPGQGVLDSSAASSPASSSPAVNAAVTGPAVPDVYTDHDGSTQLCIRRQVARLLSLLAVMPSAHAELATPAWTGWLEGAAASDDCRLASHAAKALLNLEALRDRKGADAGRAAGGSAYHAPLLLDMVHLLQPGAAHHWTLARHGQMPTADQILSFAAPAGSILTAPAAAAAAVAGAASAVTGAGVAYQSTAHGGSSHSLQQGASQGLSQPKDGTGNSSSPGLASLAASVLSSAMTLGSTLALVAAHTLSGPAPSVVVAAAAEGVEGWRATRPDMPPSPSNAPLYQPTNSSGDNSWLAGGFVAGSAAEGVAGSSGSGRAVGGPVAAREEVRAGAPKAASTADVPALASAPPEIDIVFVHGIRGGPFITWRKPGVQMQGKNQRERSVAHLSRTHVWPSEWLASDFPSARLLTLEYLAPISGWEGESLPLEATALRALDALVAAGVGERPVLFVAHSMGGLLVKEMLARSMAAGGQAEPSSLPGPDGSSHSTGGSPSDPGTSVAAAAAPAEAGAQPSPGAAHTPPHALQPPSSPLHQHHLQQPQGHPGHQHLPAPQRHARLAQATKGAVFFATPHFGSTLAAMGWGLRHMPYAAPAPALARLTPGPHLEELNEGLRALYEAGRIRVTSAAEGQAMQLSPVLPKILIVPQESAYPGFGALLPLPDADHISLCKPTGRDAPAYRAVADMCTTVLQESRSSTLSRTDGGAGSGREVEGQAAGVPLAVAAGSAAVQGGSMG